MKKPRKTRVVWTEEEEDMVVEAAVEASFEDTELLWTHFLKGQKVLPQERQKTIVGRNNINQGLIKKFILRRTELLSEKEPYSIIIEKPIEKPAESNIQSRQEIIDSISDAELMKLLATRISSIFSRLQSASEILFELAGKTETTELSEKPVQIEDTPEIPVVEKPKKTIVLLCEFLPNQQNIIIERSSDLKNLKLVFRGKNDRREIPQSNWVIMNRKASHATSDKLRSKAGSNRFIIVDGITKAVEELKNINSQS